MTIKPTISTDDRAMQCAALALDKKAFDVKVLDIRGLSTIADYLVIATGTSDKQVVAIADSIRTGLKKFGKAIDMEGATLMNSGVLPGRLRSLLNTSGRVRGSEAAPALGRQDSGSLGESRHRRVCRPGKTLLSL
jgi:hypothetical protein